jgi:hypothetical protein
LIVVVSTSLEPNKDATVQEKIDHDFLSRLAEESKQLRPWAPFQRIHVRVLVQREQSRDLSPRSGLAMSPDVDFLSVAITEQIVWSGTGSLDPREEKPDSKIHNLSEMSVSAAGTRVGLGERTSHWENR